MLASREPDDSGDDALYLPCVDFNLPPDQQLEELEHLVSFGGGFIILDKKTDLHFSKDRYLPLISTFVDNIPIKYHEKLSKGALENVEGESHPQGQVVLKPGTENLSYLTETDHKFVVDVNAKKIAAYIDHTPMQDIIFSGRNAELQELWQKMHSVAPMILEYISYGINNSLGLSGKNSVDLSAIHKTGKNNMRYAHYPESRTPNKLRCGAHKDFGTITILCQDGIGGLEVYHADSWHPVLPHPEATLWVNFGMCLEMLYDIPALIHRVVDPPVERCFGGPDPVIPSRNSAILFIDPDREIDLYPHDNSKYVPFTREQLKHANKQSSWRKERKSLQVNIMKTFEKDVVDVYGRLQTEARLDLAHEFEKNPETYDKLKQR